MLLNFDQAVQYSVKLKGNNAGSTISHAAAQPQNNQMLSRGFKKTEMFRLIFCFHRSCEAERVFASAWIECLLMPVPRNNRRRPLNWLVC